MFKLFNIKIGGKKKMNIIPNSLYEKLLTGKYYAEFPEDYFGKIERFDGKLSMESCRWLRVNNLETYYEWVIPFDKNLNIIEDYNNGFITLHPNMVIMCLRSRQNNQCSVEVSGIYDMSSQSFTDLYIDESGNSQKTNLVPSSTYRWSGGEAMVRNNNKKLVRKIVPVSKSIDSAEIFGATLNAVRDRSIVLPNII